MKTATTIKLNANLSDLTPEEACDELGHLRAALKPLLDAQKQLEKDLKATGLPVIEGQMFRATIFIADRATIAWKKIAEKLSPSKQMIVGNTTHSTTTTLRLSAHKKGA